MKFSSLVVGQTLFCEFQDLLPQIFLDGSFSSFGQLLLMYGSINFQLNIQGVPFEDLLSSLLSFSVLCTLAVLISQDSHLCHLSSEFVRLWFPFLMLWPEKSFMSVSQSYQRAYQSIVLYFNVFISVCISFLRDYCSLVPDIQCFHYHFFIYSYFIYFNYF